MNVHIVSLLGKQHIFKTVNFKISKKVNSTDEIFIYQNISITIAK